MLHCGLHWHRDQVLGVLPHVLNIKSRQQIKSSPRHVFRPHVALHHHYQRREKDVAGFNAVMAESHLGVEHLNCIACSYRPSCQLGDVSRERLGKRRQKERFSKEIAEQLRLEGMRINLKLYSLRAERAIFKKNKRSNWGQGIGFLSRPLQYKQKNSQQIQTNIHQKAVCGYWMLQSVLERASSDASRSSSWPDVPQPRVRRVPFLKLKRSTISKF